MRLKDKATTKKKKTSKITRKGRKQQQEARETREINLHLPPKHTVHLEEIIHNKQTNRCEERDKERRSRSPLPMRLN